MNDLQSNQPQATQKPVMRPSLRECGTYVATPHNTADSTRKIKLFDRSYC